jgi:hypothetical protein
MIDVTAMDDEQREELATPSLGHTYGVTVQRGSTRWNVRVTAVHVPMSWSFALDLAANLVQIAVAGLLLIRRTKDTAVLLLAAFLAGNVLGNGLLAVRLPMNVASRVLYTFNGVPSTVLNWQFIMVNVLNAVVTVLPIPLAAQFARPVSRARLILHATGYATVTLFLALIVAYFGFGLPIGPSGYGVATLTQLLVVLCLVTAVRATSGAAREQISWVASAFIIYNALVAVLNAISVYAFTQNVAFQAYWQAGDAVGEIILALMLAYAMLRRRLLSFSFALNTTIVYGGVSLFVVGAFIILEDVLGKAFDVSRTLSVAANILVALVLGFSLRAVHGRIEHLVDRTLFRKRHEDETAMVEFSRQAAFITNRHDLLARAIGVVRHHAQACTVEILLCNNVAGSAPEDDPAVRHLRASRERIDLGRYKTALHGEVAFPMISRGSLIGILICGPKDEGDSYAPDELKAIQAVADGVGFALDALEPHSDTRLTPAPA